MADKTRDTLLCEYLPEGDCQYICTYAITDINLKKNPCFATNLPSHSYFLQIFINKEQCKTNQFSSNGNISHTSAHN